MNIMSNVGLKRTFNVDTIVLKVGLRALVGIPRGRGAKTQLSMGVVHTVQIAVSKMTRKVRKKILHTFNFEFSTPFFFTNNN